MQPQQHYPPRQTLTPRRTAAAAPLARQPPGPKLGACAWPRPPAKEPALRLQSAVTRSPAALALAAFVAGSLLCAFAAEACESDSQCKGDRVCTNKVCTVPAPTLSVAPAHESCKTDVDCAGDDECVDGLCARLPPALASPAYPPPPTVSSSEDGRGRAGTASASGSSAPRALSTSDGSTAGRWDVPRGALREVATGGLGLNIESGGLTSITKFLLQGQVQVLYGLAAEFSVGGLAALGFSPQDAGSFLPITVAAVARYEKAGPVKVLAGVGFSFVPWLGAPSGEFSDAPSSFSGFTLLAQGLYPFPGTRFAGVVTVLFAPLSNSLTMTSLVASAGYSF